MNKPHYGIQWPDGTFTGAVTESHALAKQYLSNAGIGGHVYEVGGLDDPQTKEEQQQCKA